VIVIARRPQQAVHAGGDDRQPLCGAFWFVLVPCNRQSRLPASALLYTLRNRFCNENLRTHFDRLADGSAEVQRRRLVYYSVPRTYFWRQ